MIVRSGVSFVLSFLVVGLAAVVLYRPGASPPPTGSISCPKNRRGRARPANRRPRRPPHAPSVAAAPPGPSRSLPEAEVERPTPSVRRVSRPVAPTGPRSAFTTVEPGESLSDVARRVYGTDDVDPPPLAREPRRGSPIGTPLEQGDDPADAGPSIGRLRVKARPTRPSRPERSAADGRTRPSPLRGVREGARAKNSMPAMHAQSVGV